MEKQVRTPKVTIIKAENPNYKQVAKFLLNIAKQKMEGKQ